MAWNGCFGYGEEGSGLELCLGLPGYFSASPPQTAGLDPAKNGGGTAAAAAGTGAKARRSSGFKARPAMVAAAGGPVVGWPPVRAFQRNQLASPSAIVKPSSLRSHDAAGADGSKGLQQQQQQLVKVSMEGVPIGRKVDLSACGGYSALSAVVERLFRGLRGGEEEEALLDMDGYTLVYEDDEGDQMLVGDVPWDMFIATARRLRLLRTSAFNASSLGAGSRKRAASGC
ncbi:hypothetical protein ACP4OV_006803 [Aristida adscensionis]